MKKIAVVMAGGSGPKFWPRSTEKKPKQFLHLIGEGTMIQNTVFRLLPIFAPEDIYIVTYQSLAEIAEDQLPNIPKENIIVEPFGRNTAPCIALTATALSERIDPDTVMMVFPSDHVIFNVREFHQSLEIAANIASERNDIVTIGITPTRPVSAFGYIQVREGAGDLGKYYETGVHFTNTFAEKPDLATAKRFIDSGDFLWNSGIFVWKVETFWNAFELYLPEHAHLFKLLNKHIGKYSFKGVVEYIYRQMESVSVDYAILEKANNVLVVESTFSWSDLGNWDELFRLSLKDARNNFVEGDVIAINSTNCFISSNNRFVGAIGVNDLIVIDSEDSLLICRRGSSEDVNELVDYMKRKQIKMFL
jgi:mannose-1-phosphate guanylyltransferase